MNKSWMNLPHRFSQGYIAGVNAFIEFSCQHNLDKDTILCPCQNCMNTSQKTVNEIRTHLVLYGIQISYKKWVFHGEQVDLYTDQVGEPIDDEDNDDFDGLDMIQDLLGDIHRGTVGIQQQEDQLSSGNIGAQSNEEVNRFDRLLTSAQHELYPGCKSHSRLSFLLKLVHLKDLNHWSNISFEMLLKLMEVLQAGDSLPGTYYEAKKMLRDLGLGYESIHACVNDCVLFWKELEGNDECPVCKESRYKEHNRENKRVPRKVLRYFPLIPRLQRLYMNKEIASDLRYHSDKRIVQDNVLRHPSDGEAWKDLDKRYPWLEQEPRHLRLGLATLATDGFNLFGIMSSSYSVWPIIIVVYNLPPWKSMKEPFMLMPLLIPGKKSPGRDIDVYLRPLIEELKLLFNIGVVTYDASKGDTFNMHAVVLWTINDLSALGALFGYATMGYKACPMDDTYSQPLRSKIGFLGHRRYLPIHHRWRKSKNFNGKNEEALKPKLLSGNQILKLLQQLDHLQGFKYGKHAGNKKRKASQKNMEIPGKNFSKQSILFELPY
uniref:Transposase-associated domain-containing protein n=1 Tax=Oryza brachyantha TaxID=4533 RepID=J3N129_ORYBR